MNLLFATSNPAKYTAMRDALQPLGIRLLCLRDMEQVPVAPEDGSTPLENARRKALFYYDHYGIPLFSCDSGLYLENLPQELQPGLNVRSPQGVYLDDQAMLDYYGGLAAHYGDITARYRNAICLVLDREHICESMDESLASRRFLLTAKPHEVRRPGFPLDSISKRLDTGEYYYDLNAHDADDLVGYEGFVEFFRESLSK
ncbi:MAG: hypothetical protein HDR02_11450 [Lachnospiraceae bacterium]|nr:hypothetical protein [Lachnospiraceae bacterium]